MKIVDISAFNSLNAFANLNSLIIDLSYLLFYFFKCQISFNNNLKFILKVKFNC